MRSFTHRHQNLSALTAWASASWAVASIMGAAAHANITDRDVQALNPRFQKYGRCPTDTPSFILETRIIRAKVSNPSEISGDENYILPIWTLVDGMGVNPHPHVLSTGTDDIFRVNIAKRTIGGERGSNMGTMFWQRKTAAWVDLQSRDPNAYKLHLNKDFVIPISRDRWSSEGLIFSVTMMEHDNSQGRDIDKAYLQMARRIQSGLLQGATQAKNRINNPTYYGDAMKATEQFVREAAPVVEDAYAAYQTGGAAAAAGSTDLDTVTNLFSNIWRGVAKLDKDDVGEQVSIYIPFASLRPGIEKKQTVCGTTDPTAQNKGVFCVEIGVKLTLFSQKTTPSAFDQAKQAKTTPQDPPPRQTQTPKGSQPQQQKQPTAQLDGWWRGNRTSFYSIQTSDSALEMKGFSSNGSPVNLFTGTIRGNLISGSWTNFCDSRTGNAVLEFGNGKLTRISGTTANSQWLRASRPSTIQSNPSCNQRVSSQSPPSAELNLSGIWRSNDGGTYTIRQSGKTMTWESSGGIAQNTFNGWIQGTRITGFWKDAKSSNPEKSGYLSLRIQSDNKLVLVDHTGPFAGSTWERLEIQPF